MSDKVFYLGEGRMRRAANPALSTIAQQTIEHYACYLREMEDLDAKTLRGYLSDLRQFAAWCEDSWADGQETAPAFMPSKLSTPLITRYRSYLQTVVRLKPTSINRALISLKRYCAWLADQAYVLRDPAKVVKLVRQEAHAPRQLSDSEEEALIAAVSAHGSLRDRTMIILLLHTGLRAHELCHLAPHDIRLGKRSGIARVLGKRNKEREVPLNATARAALAAYLPTLPRAATTVFPSGKTGGVLTERALGHLVTKYALAAGVRDVSPHDLRHRFGYRMAEVVPLHRLAQIMGHDSLDTTMLYVRGTARDLQQEVEKIAWT